MKNDWSLERRACAKIRQGVTQCVKDRDKVITAAQA